MAPRKRTSVPQTITPADFARLLATLNPRYPSNARTRAMLALMYLGGLRCGEVCALDAGAIDRHARAVTVPHVDGLTKTGGRRVGLMPSATLDAALDAWEAVRDADNPHYFHTTQGGRVDTSQLRRRLAQIGADAGLRDVHPHTLRHSWARNALSAGVPINVVQSALGHADLATTMIYTRLSECEQIAALGNTPAAL
jgi:site-specific recombinase XerC